MKHLILAAGLLALAAPFAGAQASTWVSDPNHSEVDFSITHMSVSKVHGRFGQVKATIVYNAADVTKSTVTATIGVDTVDTGVDARNAHLKTADFFDTANLPTATFTSTSVTKNGNKLKVTGNLTLHGVTKPVVLDVEGPVTPVADPKGSLHSGFSATTTIDRTAFGIGPKFPAALVGDEVTLEIDLEVIKQ
jgi:polyisoprenoid-binding protein YceI